MTESPVLAVPQKFERATSYLVRDELGTYLSRDLLGPWDGPNEQFAVRARGPRDRYLVGMLGPKYNPLSIVEAASSMPDTEAGSGEDGEDSELRETFSVQNAGKIWASSMGMSFAVPGDVDALSLSVRWGSYRKVLRTVAENTRKAIWVRQPVEHSFEIHLDGATSVRYLLGNAGPRDERTDGETDEVPVLTVEQVPALSPDDAGVFVAVEQRELFGSDGQPRRVVELALINAQLEPDSNKDEGWIFQPELQVTALDGSVEVFLATDDPMLETADHQTESEERHLRLLYRDALKFANGRNVAVHPETLAGSRRAWRLTTTWMPTFDVPATVAPPVADTPQLAGLELSMDELSVLPSDELAGRLTQLAAGYTAWLNLRNDDIDELPHALQSTAHQAIYRARKVADRIADGIELVRTDDQALDAFRFANKAMALQRRRTAVAALREANGLGFQEARKEVDAKGPAAASWYPFQLAFVLLNLPALTDPAHPERRADDERAIVDLLFFPTGGGKTEAYLGLAAYTFAIRRLQGIVGGHDGGDGVAVLMRYTLRLLTAQQFQRAAALVCAAEYLRQGASDGRFGATPFRIGLWVGSSVAPNWVNDAREQIDEARTHGARRGVNVLQTLACPWCGERLRGEKDLHYDPDDRRVRLYCPRGEGTDACAFSQRINPEGLPIMTVDEELYRYTPSLVIATVDKLAQLPWFGFAGLLFGRVTQRCPRHGYRHPDLDGKAECGGRHHTKGRLPAVTSQPVGRLRPPDLIIQDELHLISGALGTTVGLFEGAVGELCRWEVPTKEGKKVAAGPVIVASTATTKRADAQVKALFGRDLSVFPPPVLKITDTFFSEQVPLSPAAPGRRYLGLCAHGVRLKAAEIRLAEIVLLAGQTLFDKHGKAADPYMTMVGYFNATRELAGMRRYLDDDVATRVRRNGTRRGVSNRGVSRRNGLLDVAELTSRISSGDIAAVLKRLEFGFDEELDTSVRRAAAMTEAQDARRDHRDPVYPRRNGPDPIDAVLATSMLQVGVDVSRFGLMVVTGQPKNTAEYIQASSRVGRTADRPGLVVTLYTWSRPRDLAHYEDFVHYHATFYRQVEALSVTPYARRALDRGTAATAIAALRHADDQYSDNTGAGRIPLTGGVAAEVEERLLARAQRAGGQRARDYFGELLARLRDEWSRRKQGEYPLAYKAGRENQQSYVGLLDAAGYGPWSVMTVGRSMRETENEINLLVSGGDLADPGYGAPAWTFATGVSQPDDEDTGDELGEVPPVGKVTS